METFTEKVAKTLKVTKLYLDNTTVVGNEDAAKEIHEKAPIWPPNKFNKMKSFKGCVCYIFVNLFCTPTTEDLWNKEKCFFFFYLKSSFRSWDNQVLNFQIFKCHVIKCLSMKQENTFYWITWKPNTAW